MELMPKFVSRKRLSLISRDVLRSPSLDSYNIRHSEALFCVRSWGRRHCIEWFRSCSFPEEVISNILADGIDSGEKILRSVNRKSLLRWGVRNKRDADTAMRYLDALAAIRPDGLHSAPKVDAAHVLFSRPQYCGIPLPEQTSFPVIFSGVTDIAGVSRCAIEEEGYFLIRVKSGTKAGLAKSILPRSSPLLSVDYDAPFSTKYVFDAVQFSGLVEIWVLSPQNCHKAFLCRTGILICFRRIADGHRFLHFLSFRLNSQECDGRFFLRSSKSLPVGKYFSEVDGSVFDVSADGDHSCCELFLQNHRQLTRCHFRSLTTALKTFQRHFRRRPRLTFDNTESKAIAIIRRVLKRYPLFFQQVKVSASSTTEKRKRAVEQLILFQAIIRGGFVRREFSRVFGYEGKLIDFIRIRKQQEVTAALVIQRHIRRHLSRKLTTASIIIYRFVYSWAKRKRLNQLKRAKNVML